MKEPKHLEEKVARNSTVRLMPDMPHERDKDCCCFWLPGLLRGKASWDWGLLHY